MCHLQLYNKLIIEYARSDRTQVIVYLQLSNKLSIVMVILHIIHMYKGVKLSSINTKGDMF